MMTEATGHTCINVESSTKEEADETVQIQTSSLSVNPYDNLKVLNEVTQRQDEMKQDKNNEYENIQKNIQDVTHVYEQLKQNQQDHPYAEILAQ